MVKHYRGAVSVEQVDGMRQAIQSVDDRGGPGPVFVVGAPRSGTSILGWSLDQHPDLFTSHEVDFLAELFGRGHLINAYRRSLREDGWLSQGQVDLATFARYWGDATLKMMRRDGRGDRWVDATPRHALAMYELALLFPSARFLHLVRDGRQAVDSLINSGFPIPSARRFHLACMIWRQYNDLVGRFAADFPERVMQVRYEQLFMERSTEAWSAIFDFVGVPAEPACAAFSEQRRINSSFEPNAGRRGHEGWNPWRRLLFRAIDGPMMRELGYP
jgi:hypothetical protein